MRLLSSLAVRYLGYEAGQAGGVAALLTVPCLLIFNAFFEARWMLGNNAFIIAALVGGGVYFLVWKERKRLNVQ